MRFPQKRRVRRFATTYLRSRVRCIDMFRDFSAHTCWRDFSTPLPVGAAIGIGRVKTRTPHILQAFGPAGLRTPVSDVVERVPVAYGLG